MNIITILNLVFKYYMVLAPIFRNLTFDIVFIIVCITQYLTVRRDLIFAVLNSKLKLDIKGCLFNFLELKLMELLLNYVYQVLWGKKTTAKVFVFFLIGPRNSIKYFHSFNTHYNISVYISANKPFSIYLSSLNSHAMLI